MWFPNKIRPVESSSLSTQANRASSRNCRDFHEREKSDQAGRLLELNIDKYISKHIEYVNFAIPLHIWTEDNIKMPFLLEV
jgi:hypothetical protein